ncbi:hypothetical protein BH23CHL7_BH23CHL7_04780 [soil metagenome]
MTTDPFERDLRAAVAELAPSDVPASLRNHVWTVESGKCEGLPIRLGMYVQWFGSSVQRFGGAVLGGVAVVILLTGLAALALLYSGAQGPGAGPRSVPKAVVWETRAVTFEANAVVIESGGLVFGPSSNVAVDALAGTPAYQTLEATWQEHGVEMRLNIYFGADQTHWWVDELRVYDGRPVAHWVTFEGPMFRTPLGRSYSGNVNLEGSNDRGSARLRVDGLRLTAFAPGTGLSAYDNCSLVGPVDSGVNLFRDGSLERYGVEPGMDARAAHAALVERGVCHEFRLDIIYEGGQSGDNQRWCIPPAGNITSAEYGGAGQIILFIEDPLPRTPEPIPRDLVGC